ncbi:hypothetical protein H4582DRAFT_780365 [Lactarius indigo]|nr:hypothetical protein H4582DRAFT_780365 [Lactarius indigo]
MCNHGDATTAIETRMDAIERIAMMLRGESIWTWSARPRSHLAFAQVRDASRTEAADIRLSTSTDNGDNILRDPTAYPVCGIASHIHDHSAFNALASSVRHDDAELVPASLASPDTPSSFVPPRSDIYCRLPHSCYFTEYSHYSQHLLDDDIPPRPGTFGIYSSCPDLPTWCCYHSAHPWLRHLGCLDVPSLPFPTQVLDYVPPTGPQATLNFPVTGSRCGSSSPESHSSLLAPALPGQFRPCPSSVPDPGAVIEGEGSMKAALHKERDALDPPLAVRENIMASPDLPLPSPSLSLATDVAIAGPP